MDEKMIKLKKLAGKIKRQRLKGGKRLTTPSSIRTEAVALTRELPLSDHKIAKVLGIALSTLGKWKQSEKAKPTSPAKKFRRIEVREEPSLATDSLYTVKGPMGLTVENLSLESVAELFSKLKGGRP